MELLKFGRNEPTKDSSPREYWIDYNTHTPLDVCSLRIANPFAFVHVDYQYEEIGLTTHDSQDSNLAR